METTAKLLGEIRRTVREAETTELVDAAWDVHRLRHRVTGLLDRGARALVAVGDPHAERWCEVTWTSGDAPVVLARGLATLHRRLARAVDGDAPERDVSEGSVLVA